MSDTFNHALDAYDRGFNGEWDLSDEYSSYKLNCSLGSNLSFMKKTVKENVDKIVTAGKASIDSFVVMMTTKLGLKSLQTLAKAEQMLEDNSENKNINKQINGD